MGGHWSQIALNNYMDRSDQNKWTWMPMPGQYRPIPLAKGDHAKIRRELRGDKFDGVLVEIISYNKVWDRYKVKLSNPRAKEDKGALLRLRPQNLNYIEQAKESDKEGES